MEQNRNRKELISRGMLEERIRQLGKQITNDFKGTELTIICILKGAMFFCVDLTRCIDLPLKVELIRVSSYSGESSTGRLEFKMRLDEPVTGKNVLLVEDIIDTGCTLSETLEYLKNQKPNSLKLCALLDKPERRVVSGIKADYLGFTIPNRFVIGYGLDLDESYRNLPNIQCIVGDSEEAKQIEKDKEELKRQLNM